MDADVSQAATALLTEHLQYTPLSLIDDIIDSVNNFVYQGVGSLETGLFSTQPERLGFKPAPTTLNSSSEQEYPEAKQEIEEGLHKLETLLNSTVDKNFDKFEIYVLRNILSVPQDLTGWVRLNHYDGIQHNPGGEALEIDSIHLLRRKLAASRNLNRVLQREARNNEIVLAQLRAMTGPLDTTGDNPNFSFLANDISTRIFSKQSQNPLTASTTFTMSQLPALKTAVAELRSRLSALRQNTANNGTAKDELREERREYIEQRARSYLQRNGQFSSDDASTVKGQSVDQGEIEALEKIANALNPA